MRVLYASISVESQRRDIEATNCLDCLAELHIILLLFIWFLYKQTLILISVPEGD